MNRNERQPNRAYEGQVLILIAIGSIILLAFAAMAVDAGLALSERRGAQNAADAASLAAARAMVDGETNQALLREMAQHYAQLNGYEIADLANDVRFPNAETVEVDISHQVPRVFLGAFYDGDWSVRTTATASLDTVPADYGLIALDETGNSILMSGNTHVGVVGGGVFSNSNIRCEGSSSVSADTNVDTAGIIDSPGSWCPVGGDEGSREGLPTIEDPLAGTPVPPSPFPPPSVSPGACVGLDYPTPWNPMIECSPGRYTSWSGPQASGYGLRLLPGTYVFDTNFSTNPWGTNEIEMVPGGAYTFYVRNSNFAVNNTSWDMGSNNVTMYFQNSTFTFTGGTREVVLGSGLYYFDNSTFHPASGATGRGENVSFFFTNGGEFKASGSTTDMRFTAPSYPLYPGMPPNMLIHAPPSNTTFRVDLGAYTANTLLDGLIYLPSGHFRLSGNTSGTWARGQLIVGRYSAAGSSNGLVEYEQYLDMGTPQVWLTR